MNSQTRHKYQEIQSRARRIIRRNVQNAADARAIAALGCDCGKPHGQHMQTCPVQIAEDAICNGLWEPTTEEAGECVRHLAEPHTAKRESARATCSECGRYARSEKEIRHRPGCGARGD
jgi:hypothetical protein